MLLFIPHDRYAVVKAEGFQNIVCYCLSTFQYLHSARDRISKHRMLLFIRLLRTMTVLKTDFKTSYVTVYHLIDLIRRQEGLFQNIVCYCLSYARLEHICYVFISKHRMLLFIINAVSGTLSKT